MRSASKRKSGQSGSCQFQRKIDKMPFLIDGLDELTAARESDPVYRVLGQLIAADCPRFILSCRAADWRGAVARQDISDEYGAPPVELSLEPFSEVEAIAYLTHSLGADRASEVVSYLDDKGIPDLFGNPLTLNLFGEVASQLTVPRAAGSRCRGTPGDRPDRGSAPST